MDFETLELSMIAFIVLLFYFLIYSIWVFEVKSCPTPCLSSTFAQRVSLNEYEQQTIDYTKSQVSQLMET